LVPFVIVEKGALVVTAGLGDSDVREATRSQCHVDAKTAPTA
jgi:hypothetical protein